MKSIISSLGFALMSSGLLLSLSPGCGPKQPPVNPQTPESPTTPATAMVSPTAMVLPTAAVSSTPTPTPTPKPSPPSTPTTTPTTGLQCLAGDYTLINPEEATRKIKEAIEVSVKDLPAKKDDARKKLEETNLPPPGRISISCSATEVSIETKVAGKLTTAVDGTPTPWTWKEEKYEVRTKLENGKLERTFEGNRRSRRNTYSLGDGGKTLTMQVHATATKIVIVIPVTVTLDYALTYRRN